MFAKPLASRFIYQRLTGHLIQSIMHTALPLDLEERMFSHRVTALHASGLITSVIATMICRVGPGYHVYVDDGTQQQKLRHAGETGVWRCGEKRDRWRG